MADRPLLILPSPSVGPRKKQKTGFAALPLPSHAKQKRLIGPQFKALDKALQSKAATLQETIAGAVPEQVVVLEAVGPVSEFYRAVERIPGLEWLVELEDETEVEESLFDEVLFDEKLAGRLFLVMANQEAMNQLLTLWKAYQRNRKATFPKGLARFRELFTLLKGVRTWNARDRVGGTGLDEFIEGRLDPNERVRIEVELWFRQAEVTRNKLVSEIKELLKEEQGAFISEAALESIRYHAVLVELPLSAVRRIAELSETRLTVCEDVMFLRPASQFVVWTPTDDRQPELQDAFGEAAGTGEPIVAILDGMPVENHVVLRGHLILDDPDGFAAAYPVDARYHGTAMASLVLRGDLHDPGQTLGTPIYMRPVLKPVGQCDGSYAERMPDDRLPVDLIHRAVVRMFEAAGESKPAAPTVKIINFSIGDPARHFAVETSPLARLLDWLSWKYGVLFVVSAGNHAPELTLGVPCDEFPSLSAIARQRTIISTLAREAAHRRLLSPAESVNALTVGASHRDSGPTSDTTAAWNPYTLDGCISPISALGRGFNRAVKPEILADGGRLHFREWPTTGPNAVIRGVVATRAPGQRVAMPAVGGDLRVVGNVVGTSNAAALATRAAAQFYAVSESLRNSPQGKLLDQRCSSALIKASMVHSSSWQGAQDMISDALSGEYDDARIKDMTIRALGYGKINPHRILAAADERATLIGCGLIGADQAHDFRVPLPPGLAGKKVWRRLTLTLAWMTPVDCGSRAYRRALLFVAPQVEDLQVARQEVDWRTVRRGTVQHEVFAGEKASAFADGSELALTVVCKSPRSRLKENVPYALVASLEVAQDVGISIYSEVRDRLTARVAIGTGIGAVGSR